MNNVLPLVETLALAEKRKEIILLFQYITFGKEYIEIRGRDLAIL